MNATEWPKDVDVVVTGGTGALGSAVVGTMLERGARVHVPWLVEHEVERFAFRDRAKLAKLDLGDEGGVVEFYAGIPRLYASVHVAGGFAMSALADTTGAEFERLWRLNGLTCFLCCREAVRAMRAAAGFAERGGRIVNVAARPVVRPAGGMIAYGASKAVVGSVTESLGEELKDERILVNAVVPSIMDTPANRAAMPKADHAAWPKVSEVAQAIAFLASPANALTSGALVPVYGRS